MTHHFCAVEVGGKHMRCSVWQPGVQQLPGFAGASRGIISAGQLSLV